MKWLVIALLTANLAFFGWHYNQQVETAMREATVRKPPASTAPPLQLLAELGTLPAQKAGDGASATAPTVAPTAEVHAHIPAADRCLDIGPFDDSAVRDRLRDWLREYVARLQTRAEAMRQRQFFWVYLEPTSDESAQQSLADLRAHGVTDYMLIRRGDLKNAISLGLFRSQDSVNRRLAEMTEKGYQPIVVPRFETSERYWVSAQLAAAHSERLDLPETLLGGTPVRSIDCALLADRAE